MTRDDELLTPAEVSELTRGRISEGALAQRRYQGLPPAFLKPTPRTVLYKRSSVEEWLDSSERTSTRATA